jgi:hypothetical protein
MGRSCLAAQCQDGYPELAEAFRSVVEDILIEG